MSAKHPTLGQLLAEHGYPEGALRIPRVARFIGKQRGSKWQRIRHLIRKRARRR